MLLFLVICLCIIGYIKYSYNRLDHDDISKGMFIRNCVISFIVGAAVYIGAAMVIFNCFAKENLIEIRPLVSLAAPAKNDFLVGLDYDKERDVVFYIFKYVDKNEDKKELHFDKNKTHLGIPSDKYPSVCFFGNTVPKWISFFNSDGIITKISVSVPEYTSIHEFYD